MSWIAITFHKVLVCNVRLIIFDNSWFCKECGHKTQLVEPMPVTKKPKTIKQKQTETAAPFIGVTMPDKRKKRKFGKVEDLTSELSSNELDYFRGTFVQEW